MEMSDILKKHFESIENKFGAVPDKVREALARVDELEQKMDRVGTGSSDNREPTWGEQFVAAEELKSFAKNTSRPARFRMEVKATLSSDAASGGALAPPIQDRTINAMPQRRLTVRNLLNVLPVTSGSVEYPRQTTRTNNANTVAEGTLKPESDLAYAIETVPIRTIAHWIPASRQILEDVPQLQNVIDTELRYGLSLKEEAQLLAGDGIGQNLTGLITAATAYVAPFDPAGTETMIDTLALAILQNALAEEPATGIVVHPSDWMRMRLLKDADGKYLLGDPGAQVAPQLFGLPVVPTQAMTVDKFLVGNFQRAATLYDRWAPRVEVSTDHADFFTRNLVAILCEERIGLAIKNPAALTFGDFGNVV